MRAFLLGIGFHTRLALTFAAFGAVFYLVPASLPLAAPSEGSSTGKASLCGQISFFLFCHGRLLSTLRPTGEACLPH